MSQVPKETIESSLVQKGFVQENTHHRYFHHEYKGKRTGVSTFTSHGSKYKTYGDSLLKSMKNQLRLDTLGDVKDLLLCPMDGETYNNKLIGKNVFTKEP